MLVMFALMTGGCGWDGRGRRVGGGGPDAYVPDGGGGGGNDPRPAPLVVVIDTDGDGIADFFDDFPLDPSRHRFPTFYEREIFGNTNDGRSVAEYLDNPIELPARLIGRLQTSRQVDMDYWAIFVPEAGSWSAVCTFEPGVSPDNDNVIV